MRNRFLLPAIVASLATSLPVLADPVEYQLRPEKSLVYVQVFKDPNTMGASLSHDHIIMATGWRGDVTWDAANPGACSVQIKIPVRGLIVDEAGMRSRVGYESTLSDSQRKEVKDNMLADNQLAGSKYPDITFNSTSCKASGSSVAVTGNMTVRGKSSPVTAQMTISADATNFSASGSFKATHGQFGMEPFSAMFGQLKNNDRMTFALNFKGTAK